MFVGCWDCGKPLKGKSIDRPKSIKTGMKNTVSVCKKCELKWWLKQAKKEQRDSDNGNMYDSNLIKKSITKALKYLEDSL